MTRITLPSTAAQGLSKAMLRTAPAAKLRKALREELGLKVIPGKELFRVEHGYSHFSITVRVFDGRLREAIPTPMGNVKFRWAGPKDFSRLALSSLERKILKGLQAKRSAGKPFADGKTAVKHDK